MWITPCNSGFLVVGSGKSFPTAPSGKPARARENLRAQIFPDGAVGKICARAGNLRAQKFPDGAVGKICARTFPAGVLPYSIFGPFAPQLGWGVNLP